MRATISGGTSGKSMSGVSGLQVEDGMVGEKVGDAGAGVASMLARASAACRAHAGAQKGAPPVEVLPKMGKTGVAGGEVTTVGVHGESGTRRGVETVRIRAGLGTRKG